MSLSADDIVPAHEAATAPVKNLTLESRSDSSDKEYVLILILTCILMLGSGVRYGSHGTARGREGGVEEKEDKEKEEKESTITNHTSTYADQSQDF